jgi:hypothetical protein
MGLAAEWVARLTVVGIEMVVFGLAGVWLDKRLRVEPLFALIGFAVGISVGIFHLLLMATHGQKHGNRTGDSPLGKNTRRPGQADRNESRPEGKQKENDE